MCFFVHSFLRSMTALLDPAQIEERDRRRQKQLEHQVYFCFKVERMKDTVVSQIKNNI